MQSRIGEVHFPGQSQPASYVAPPARPPADVPRAVVQGTSPFMLAPVEASNAVDDVSLEVVPVDSPGWEPSHSNVPDRSTLAQLFGIASQAFWLAVSSIGAVVMVIALAVAASVPILQFLSLGYLLEISGRIARSGRLRDGCVGLRPAGLAGLAGFALFLCWLPLRFATMVAANAEIIAPGSRAARIWEWGGAIGVTALLLGMAAVLALGAVVFRNAYRRLRDRIWKFVVSDAPHLGWLGLRAFLGGALWLALPTSMLVLASILPNYEQPLVLFTAGLLRFGGLFLLAIVAAYLPFLQTRLAVEGRWRAMFEVGAVRQAYRRAPVAHLAALTALLALALPLYLLKIEVVPRDALALPSLIFVVFMLPARVLIGWAVGRGRHREAPRHFIFRQLGRLGMAPVAAVYALIVFLSQYAGWHGIWGMYEQHAFLLPVPFFGL